MNFMLTSCFGAQSRNRTNDTGIFSPLLYRLSYLGIWRRRRDLNPRIPFERIYSLSRGASSAT